MPCLQVCLGMACYPVQLLSRVQLPCMPGLTITHMGMCCSQDTEEFIAISAATNGDRLMAEEEQAAAKVAAKKAKRLKQKARSKQKQAAAQTLSGQLAALTLGEEGKQQQPAAEPLHDEFSRLLAKFVARSDPTLLWPLKQLQQSCQHVG